MSKSKFRKPSRGKKSTPSTDAFVHGDEPSPEIMSTLESESEISPEDLPMKKATGIYFTQKQKKWLKLKAVEEDTNVSEIVRRLVDKLISR